MDSEKYNIEKCYAPKKNKPTKVHMLQHDNEIQQLNQRYRYAMREQESKPNKVNSA